MNSKFDCPYPTCKKSYVSNTILKRHIQATHNLEKRFRCSVCGKCLASQQNLTEHSYIHTGEKPYICQVPRCNFASRQGTHLSAHKRLYHSELGQGDNPRPGSVFDSVLKFLTGILSQEEKNCLSEEKVEQVELPAIKLQFKYNTENLL